MHTTPDNEFPDYTEQELLLNEAFQRWAMHPDDEALNAWWAQWQEKHPHKKAQLQTSAALIRGIRFPEETLAMEEQALLWEQVNAEAGEPRRPRLLPQTWLRAAIVVGIVALGALYWQTRPTHHEAATAFGETRNVTLPDGSVVTLNANSRLRYAKNWENGAAREVWLSGEAYFNVRHLAQPGGAVPFTVSTSTLQVNVLGTTFNVKDRRRTTEVVLSTGSVRLSADAENNVLMQPGHKAVWHADSRQMEQHTTDTADATAWRKNEIVLKETSVLEIAEMLEDNYGLRSFIPDSTIANRRLDGRVTVNNANDLLNMLRQVLCITIDQKNHDLFFYR